MKSSWFWAESDAASVFVGIAGLAIAIALLVALLIAIAEFQESESSACPTETPVSRKK